MAKKKKTPSRRRASRRPKKKKPPISADALFQQLELKAIRLIGVQAKLEIRDNTIPNRAKINYSASVGPSVDNKLHANAILEVVGEPKDGGDSVIRFQAHYQCILVAIDADLEQFVVHAEQIAKFGMWMLWPYFRELVQSTTSKMAIPAFTLPVLVPGEIGDHVATLDDE